MPFSAFFAGKNCTNPLCHCRGLFRLYSIHWIEYLGLRPTASKALKLCFTIGLAEQTTYLAGQSNTLLPSPWAMCAPTLFSLYLPQLITVRQNRFSIDFHLTPVENLRPKSAMFIAWRKMMTSLLAVERLENLARKAPLDRAHLRAAAPLNR